jgi:Domain of unknown function (DUF4126)
MVESLGIMEVLGIAGSVSLLSGWRLYLTVLATGLAMHYQVLPLPEHLQSLQILANPWVMGAAGTAAFFEFFADKVLWLDSVRPGHAGNCLCAGRRGQPAGAWRQGWGSRGGQHQPGTGQQRGALHR